MKRIDIKHSKPIHEANVVKTGRKDCYTVVSVEKTGYRVVVETVSVRKHLS